MALVFGVGGVLDQRLAVAPVGRIVEPFVRGDEDLDAGVLARLDQVKPLADLAGAAGRLPQNENISVELAGLQVRQQAGEGTADLLAVAAGADSVGLRVALVVESKSVLVASGDVIAVLLLGLRSLPLESRLTRRYSRAISRVDVIAGRTSGPLCVPLARLCS